MNFEQRISNKVAANGSHNGSDSGHSGRGYDLVSETALLPWTAYGDNLCELFPQS